MSKRRENDETDDEQTTDNTDGVPNQEESVYNDSVILIYGAESSCPWLICQAIRDANDKH